MKKQVLGIKIDDINIEQAVQRILGFLKQGGKHYVSPKAKGKVLAKRGFYIVTPNPEIVMMAQKDQQLKKILNNAALAVPDGVGLKIASDIVCYTPGIDLMEALIKASLDYGFTIGLLGGKPGVAKKADERLRKKYPGVKIVYADSELIGSPKLDLLFVGFGAPKQEKWVAENINKLDVKVMMVVGGSLDYISGYIPRAPVFLRKLGLEWLFRLIIQPWRIKRQLALLKYLWLVLS